MLKMALTILHHRELYPEATLSSGPVLELMDKEIEALDFLPGASPVGPDVYKKD